MIEHKTGVTVADEIAKAGKIGDEHGTTVRHCLERREPKRFAGLCQRGINEHLGRAIFLFEFRSVEDRAGERRIGSFRNRFQGRHVSVAATSEQGRYPAADDFADRHLCLPLWRAIPVGDLFRTLHVLTSIDPGMIGT